VGGREQKERILGSTLEERIVRLGLIHKPGVVTLPRFENSRNVEMSTPHAFYAERSRRSAGTK
jgi:hypothetical protein